VIPNETTESTVPDALAGERLDRVVAVIAEVTRSEAAELVDAGDVVVNGLVIVRRSHRVVLDDLVRVTLPKRMPAPSLVPDPDVQFPVVYVDDDVIVVDKPAGLVVHPGAGNQHRTLVHGLLARFPDLAALAIGDNAIRPGIVHRLDKGTSGLLMVARTTQATENLIEQLKARSVSRHYLALAHGRFAAQHGVIDAPVGRSDSDPTKMTVSASGRDAVTNYRVQQAFERPEPCSLIECWLETGRTHQIRVHLSAIGHPVVGDPRYGGLKGSLTTPRPWLHAFSLRFLHPATAAPMSFESPVPDDLNSVLAALE
jgi:23S rRNA pseudouridine1911/1915/1917 synthase